jgi:hypothetical protein
MRDESALQMCALVAHPRNHGRVRGKPLRMPRHPLGGSALGSPFVAETARPSHEPTADRTGRSARAAAA